MMKNKRYQQEKRLLHGGDYNPDQWLKYPQILADDLCFMKKVRANTFSVGIFAWAALEPSEGQFEFAWLDKIMDDIAGIGGNVILATPSGARPAWLAQKYPEVLRLNARREKQLFGGRHNHCFSSPIYREKAGIINRKLAERYKDHPALLMWHISNEYSGDCHCELCQENFRRWLKAKYGTVEALNNAYWNGFWSHTYSDFSQAESPSPIGESAVHALTLDWKRFATDQTIDFYHHEIIPLREITPDIAITTNFMAEIAQPYPHPFAGLDYARFAPEMDIISWDAYPNWHNDYETTEFLASKLAFLNDYFRTLKGQPFLILESTPSMVNWHKINKPKRPGMHLLSTIACLAHGADSMMYFQWRKSRGSSEKFHGAVVDHDNSENNRVFKDVQAVGEVLENIMEIKGSHTPARVALLYDLENYWALCDVQGFQREDKQYPRTIHEHYKVFWDANVPMDVITKDKDLSKYDMVIAPMLYMVDAKQMEVLKAYVEGGGTLISTYLLGLADENDLVHLGGLSAPLRDVFGVNILEIDTLYPKDRNGIVYGKVYEAFDYCTVMEACGAEVLGRYSSDFYKDSPAVTRNKLGKGQAYFIGARTGSGFLRDIYGEILGGLALPELPVKGSAGVSIQIRENADFCYYFVMNFNEAECEITLAEDMPDLISGETVPKGRQSLGPYGVYIFKQKHG